MTLDFRIAGLGPDAVDYLAAWELQRQVHARVVAGDQPPTVLLLEHPPVFTAGKRTTPDERPADPGGAPVIDVDRGGKITFHGPGQLVGYPIVALPDHVKVVDYVRRVEEALIGVCRDLGVETARVPGRSGVWLRADDRGPERKVAAIGIRVSRGVTMHGFALNCDVDLGWYDRFVPCGIADAGVTSLSEELGRRVTVSDVLPLVERHLTRPAGVGAVRPRRPTTRRGPSRGARRASSCSLRSRVPLLAVVVRHRRVVVALEVDRRQVAAGLCGDEPVEVELPSRPHAQRVLGVDVGLAERERGHPVGLAEVDVEVPPLLADLRGHGEPPRRLALADLHLVPGRLLTLERHREQHGARGRVAGQVPSQRATRSGSVMAAHTSSIGAWKVRVTKRVRRSATQLDAGRWE